MYRKYGRTQPPPGATIDWVHPLAQRVDVCLLFNESSGAQTVNLAQPNKNGTVVGTPPRVGTPLGGTGLLLDGLTQQVNLGVGVMRPTVAANGIPLSGCVWLRTTQNGNGSIVSNANAKTTSGWQWRVLGGPSVEFCTTDNGDNPARGIRAASVSDGVFRQLGFSWNGVNNSTGMQLYRNGRLDAITARSDTDSGALIDAGVIVGSSLGVANFLSGTFGAVMLWSRVLTPADFDWLNQEPFAMIQAPRSISYYNPYPVSRIAAAKGVLIGGGAHT